MRNAKQDLQLMMSINDKINDLFMKHNDKIMVDSSMQTELPKLIPHVSM